MLALKKLLLLFILFCPLPLLAEEGVLILNAENQAQEPEHFRATPLLDLSQLPSTFSKEGLDKLNISGSAQFSEGELKIIQEKIPNLKVIFDLRQESHGFLNGHAISWLTPKNWINLGLSNQEVEKREKALNAGLMGLKNVQVFKLNSEGGKEAAKVTQWETLTPQEVVTEETLAQKMGLVYHRIYVTDDQPPAHEEVDRFVKFWESVPKGEVAHFHCQNGDGRTTTFMVLADMLENARRVSFQDILARQAAMGGVDLTNLPSPQNYKYNFEKARLAFLQKFYSYANSTSKRRPKWSQWLKNEGRGEK